MSHFIKKGCVVDDSFCSGNIYRITRDYAFALTLPHISEILIHEKNDRERARERGREVYIQYCAKVLDLLRFLNINLVLDIYCFLH